MVLKGKTVCVSGVYDYFIEARGEIITYIGEKCPDLLDGETYIDFGSNYICPGFVDIHVHGSGGADVMDCSFDALDKMSFSLAQGGTTSFLATVISAPQREMLNAIKNVSEARSRVRPA